MSTLAIKVYYEDTDAGGVVYHARFLHFLERARTEFLAELGFTHTQLVAQNALFVVRHISIDYLKPAKLEDALIVHTSIQSYKGPKIFFEQYIERAGVIICKAEVLIVTINNQFEPINVPDSIARKMNL